ncbi:Origin recognition complex subunit 1, partial [Tetrabaena socialis]
VASTTGDVRRALELLRRATEITEAELAASARQQGQAQQPGGAKALINVVGSKQANFAIREMYGSVHMSLLRSAGAYQKLVLVALLVEMRAQNKPEVTVAALHHRLNSHVALLMGAAALPLARVVEAAAALGAQRLVVAEAAWQGPGMRVALNVPQDDVVALLREDPSLALVQSCLA